MITRPGAPVALVEVLDRDGRVRHSVALPAWPLRVGRAIDNDVVLDDPHVASHHFAVWPDAGGTLRLQVMAGLNGVQWGRQRLREGETGTLPLLAAGQTRPDFVAGATRLRLRLAADALEPERVLPQRGRHGITLAVALVLWTWLLAEQAILLDPGSRASEWLAPALGVPAVVAGWCAVWALASKLFQHRFDFWPHLAVVVRGLLATELASALLPWLSAITGWAGFARVATGVAAAVALATLVAQIRLVLPQQRRLLVGAAAAAYAAGVMILIGLNLQRNEHWYGELYTTRLPPALLVWHRAVAPARFVAATDGLEAVLRRNAAESEADRPGGDEDE